MDIPYFRPDITDNEIEAVASVLRSGWISTGPIARQLEENFQKYLNLPLPSMANAVSSATAGLHLALEALGVNEESTVYLPTMTFTATAEVCKYMGAKIELIDSETNHPNMSLDLLIEKIAESSDHNIFVMPVHFGGKPVDIPLLRSEIKKEIHIIEDAAHAFPAKLNGKLVGNLESDATVFSFYANKTLTTGEGGMVITRDASVGERIQLMRTHGIDRNAFDRYQGNRFRSWEYDVLAPGFKYNLSDVLAAIGVVQFKKVERMREKRAEIARYYDEAFTNLPVKSLGKDDAKFESSWHIYSIDIEEGFSKDRDQVMLELSDLGIQTSLHYIPLHLLTYWKKSLNFKIENFPNANKRYANTLSLPIFPNMKDNEIEYVAQAVNQVLK